MKNRETIEKEKTKRTGEHPYWARPIRGRCRLTVVVRANARCTGAPEERIPSRTCRSRAGPAQVKFPFLFFFLFIFCFFTVSFSFYWQQNNLNFQIIFWLFSQFWNLLKVDFVFNFKNLSSSIFLKFRILFHFEICPILQICSNS
jgi:hypothetical protein